MVLGIFMRWVHITTVVLLIGSVFYARGAGSTITSSFSSAIYWLTAGLLVSGTYNYLTKSSFPPHYHMWFGIKMLLVLHVLSMAILLTRRNVEDYKRRRWMTNIQYSGLLVILVSAILRWLTQNPAAVKLP